MRPPVVIDNTKGQRSFQNVELARKLQKLGVLIVESDKAANAIG